MSCKWAGLCSHLQLTVAMCCVSTDSDHHDGGRRVAGTACDWTFSSLDVVKGELHTPDSVLYNVTTCRYDFSGVDHYDRVELQIIAEQLRKQPPSLDKSVQSRDSCVPVVSVDDSKEFYIEQRVTIYRCR